MLCKQKQLLPLFASCFMFFMYFLNHRNWLFSLAFSPEQEVFVFNGLVTIPDAACTENVSAKINCL